MEKLFGLLQRFIGFAIIVLTIVYARSDIAYDAYYGVKDCSFALVTIPMGMWMMFGSNVYKYIYNK